MLGVRRLFGRIATGFALTRDSVGVLRNHPKLAILPLISAVATIGYLVAMLGPALLLESTVGLASLGQEAMLVGLFVWYFGTAFIAAFFNGALVHATGDVFAGKEPSLKRSLKAATGELKLLLVWATASAIVGLLLRGLESSDSIAADLVRVVISLGWTVMTFFVLPVVMFEDTSVRGMFRESGRTFRDTWGETIGVSIGITLSVAVATLALLAVTVGPAVVLGLGTVGILLGIAVLVLAYLAYATIWGVVKTALYGYAKEGTTPAEFENVDLGRLGEESADAGGRI